MTSIKQALLILGARKDEGIYEAAKRVVAERDDALTLLRFFAGYTCHCNIINEGRGPRCAPCEVRAFLKGKS